MSTTTRLQDAIKGFPDVVLAEVVDFAEFLREKKIKSHAPAQDEPLIALAGGLEQSNTFGENPIALQKRLRDEWH